MPLRTRLGLTAGLLLALALESSAAIPPPEGFLSSFSLQSDDPAFGGLSAIEISDDGTRFTALSDRTRFVTGQIDRDGDGHITAVQLDPMQPLRGKGEAPLAPGRGDSEGLAITESGTAYVSLEGVPRVLRYEDLEGSAENLPTPPAFSRLRKNAALEALAVDAKGQLFTLPEDVADTVGFPAYRFSGGAWTVAFHLPRDGAFLPVGADFGPDGRLYILERQFHGIPGFSSRVRALTLNRDGSLAGIETVMQSPTGFHDNLEGIAAWADAQGRLRLTMISDDNFLPWQRGEIVEYSLAAPKSPAPAG
ncbi:esterase-like activity of phytase family protein [Neotabrizicola shimadae]|uniref:Esterase-like activity of phytase family protein n=1 Tax=Neotabrizicola shimadae TaxID=2807096 RepID=A0A8G1ECC7_9RHOB|nr:esterase-like activity of phytase family protein [Neotabrizicola shimadae]QYZ68938.1 esterase-like activity of phytase family protein [Neotabrizicola shimadae]